MMAGRSINRREFLQVSGGGSFGLLIGFSRWQRDSGQSPSVQQAFSPDPFLRIGPDETVTVVLGKSEMGTGIYTALAMLVAEELEADWRRVRVESAPVDSVYDNPSFGMQMTGGSTSVQSEWERLRLVGAAARVMLIAAAARRWNVDPQSCRAENGHVLHPPSQRRLSFGTLANFAVDIVPPVDVPLKNPSEFKLIGKPTRRLDTPSKVNGTAQFGIDARVPGMLTAVIARPPVFGARVVRVDDERTRQVAGVRAVVPVQSGVAVVADGYWPAKRGRDALRVEWEEGTNATISTASLREQYAALSKTPGAVIRRDGDPVETLQRAARRVSAEYEVPYLAHAMMEPLNCLVDLRTDRCAIWTGTQFQSADRAAAAKTAGLKPEQVDLHTMLLGGGFGRRGSPTSDFVIEAVEVAKAVREPVKVIWTREDDIRGGWYRPIAYDRLSAGLDEHGNPVAWSHTVVSQSVLAGTMFESFIDNGIDGSSVEGAREMPYSIPNVLVDLHTTNVGVPVSWWRSVGNSHTAFVVESFLDELAYAAGKDPYEFRRGLLTDRPRHLRVLDLAASRANWGASLPRGRSRGIALHLCFDTCVAEVADVSVNDEGMYEFTAWSQRWTVVSPSTRMASRRRSKVESSSH